MDCVPCFAYRHASRRRSLQLPVPEVPSNFILPFATLLRIRYELWTPERIADLHLYNRKAYKNSTEYVCWVDVCWSFGVHSRVVVGRLAGKADILRYEILYKFGGIYIDADMAWLGTRDLGELISKTNSSGLFVANECKRDREAFANSIIGSSQYNPVMYLTLRTLGRVHDTCGAEMPWLDTGPYFLDQVLHDIGVTVFPYYYFFPKYWVDLSGSMYGDKGFVQLDEKAKQFPESFTWHFGYTTNRMQASAHLGCCFCSGSRLV